MYLLGATVHALADKAKGVGCIDKFVSQVQPVTVMKGEKFSGANELLVKEEGAETLARAIFGNHAHS